MQFQPAAPAVTVRVDSTAPVVTVASPQSRDYLDTDVLTVSVTATDVTSGVAGAATSTLDGNAVATSTIPLLGLATPCQPSRLASGSRGP
jgi:hypothetical protein